MVMLSRPSVDVILHVACRLAKLADSLRKPGAQLRVQQETNDYAQSGGQPDSETRVEHALGPGWREDGARKQRHSREAECRTRYSANAVCAQGNLHDVGAKPNMLFSR